MGFFHKHTGPDDADNNKLWVRRRIAPEALALPRKNETERTTRPRLVKRPKSTAELYNLRKLLIREALDEIEFGNDGITRLYASLLIDQLLSLEPKLKTRFGDKIVDLTK